MRDTLEKIQFNLPGSLSCPQPTELRNIARDEVRLLVTSENGIISHSAFHQLDKYLQEGDVLVVNTSATGAAAFQVDLPDGTTGMVHFSTRLPSNVWLAEIRQVHGNKTRRWNGGFEGLNLALPGGLQIILNGRYFENRDMLHLWKVSPIQQVDLSSHMDQFGQPIKYENLDQPYPLDYYQTLFSSIPGSSEMPSAGRAFTERLINKLLDKGIRLAPVLLHTGISSLEENEPLYPEYMEIDSVSSTIINQAKTDGNRVIAVGTTAVRSVESATDFNGKVGEYKGYTDLYITPDFDMKVIDGLLTGFHEPEASHLNMLQALAGQDHIERAYDTAIEKGYYWHQFGDLHLIL